MKNLLIADIGGTNTRILVTNLDGMVQNEYKMRGLAKAFESNNSIPELEKQLEKIPDKEKIGAIAINLGGKNTEQITKSFHKIFPQVPLVIFRESEGCAAFALADEYDAQIVLMAGTGTIAVGRSDNGYVTCGGWGMNVGDDGSGYDIGLQAIRKTLRALDDTSPLTPLMQYICKSDGPFCATETPAQYKDMRDGVREKLYPLDRQSIASYSKAVYEFAQKGDKTAIEILNYSGKKLSELVICIAKKLSGKISAIVVTGGLVNTRDFWAENFEGDILNSVPDVKINYVSDGLLKGTLKIAKDLYKKGEAEK